MRGETITVFCLPAKIRISIHSPHARGDVNDQTGAVNIFISIHSPHARGDTITLESAIEHQISIHSPHARGDASSRKWANQVKISIHSPHARGDICCKYFSSAILISIHSPHARGDKSPCRLCSCSSNFNPLPSCEGRQDHLEDYTRDLNISIHSPHARGDRMTRQHSKRLLIFQSTPLMRGETVLMVMIRLQL